MGLREWILTHCMTRAGGLNNRIALPSWWQNKGFGDRYDELVAATSYLSTDSIVRRVYHAVHGPEVPSCPVCGREPGFQQFKSGYRQYCSLYCSTQGEERRRRISENNDYGRVMESVRRTNLERYGVEHGFQRADVIQKIVDAKMDRYGTLNPGLDKIRRTNLERYGSECWFSSVAGRERLREVRLNEGWGHLGPEVVARLNDIDLLVKMNETMRLDEIASELGVTPRAVINKFEVHGIIYRNHPPRVDNSQQKMLFDFISSHIEQSVSYNDRRIIPPREIDVVVADRRIGFEFNGIVAHSEGPGVRFSKENQNYHLEKLEAAERVGWRLIHVFEYDWRYNRTAVEGVIRSTLGSYDRVVRASGCELRTPTYAEERDFLNTYHLQGHAWSSARAGLYVDGELSALMSVGRSRFDPAYDCELLRFCVKPGLRIHGAGSRLLKSLGVRGRMISYCDRTYHAGGLYRSLGFRMVRTTRPSYVWVNLRRSRSLVKRFSSQKHKLYELLGDQYDPTLTEAENMFSAGYGRYWNCGNSVWEKEFV